MTGQTQLPTGVPERIVRTDWGIRYPDGSLHACANRAHAEMIIERHRDNGLLRVVVSREVEIVTGPWTEEQT